MPNPKSGTVVPNLKAAIKEVTAGCIGIVSFEQAVCFFDEAKSGSLLEYRAEGEGELKAMKVEF